jgi:hypothetical protein
LNEDFLDLLRELLDSGVRFMVVGAHALAVHGVPRATGDLDVWIEMSPSNAARVWRALVAFGAPVESVGLSEQDLCQPDRVIQIGLPPRRIDVMTEISGVAFADAWADRVTHELNDMSIPFIGRAHLVANKRATGRTRDLADLEDLDGLPTQ